MRDAGAQVRPDHATARRSEGDAPSRCLGNGRKRSISAAPLQNTRQTDLVGSLGLKSDRLLVADNRVWFGANGTSAPRLKRFLHEVQDGVIASSLWLREEVGDNLEAKREVVALNSQDVFATPKPERLLQRVLQLATSPGDLVLDSFAGSGTTGAVAQKMCRRWIMVELGEHCPPMARSNSPTLGHPKFPQAGRPDYDDSGVMAMRAAASLRR